MTTQTKKNPGLQAGVPRSSRAADPHHHNPYPQQLRARRAASRRIEHGDPWTYPSYGSNGLDAAIAHLAHNGLTGIAPVTDMRAVWAGASPEDRTYLEANMKLREVS